MESIFIELTDGSVYVSRLEPTSASAKPLSDKEVVILDLYRQLESIKDSEKKILEIFITWYNAKPKVNKRKDGLITIDVVNEFLK